MHDCYICTVLKVHKSGELTQRNMKMRSSPRCMKLMQPCYHLLPSIFCKINNNYKYKFSILNIVVVISVIISVYAISDFAQHGYHRSSCIIIAVQQSLVDYVYRRLRSGDAILCRMTSSRLHNFNFEATKHNAVAWTCNRHAFASFYSYTN